MINKRSLAIYLDSKEQKAVRIIGRLVAAHIATNKKDKEGSAFKIFRQTTVDKIIDCIKDKHYTSALVIDDIGCQVIKELLKLGITDITYCCSVQDRKLYNAIVYYIRQTFKEYDLKFKMIGDLDNMNVNLVISNPPYGGIGANITRRVRQVVNYTEFINLEPGNDYFIDGEYKYISKEDSPIVLENGAFEDANQATTIARINKEENDLSEIEARTLLSIRNDDKQVYTAISELLVKINSVKTLSFTRRSVPYSDDWFVFNSGGFEIHGGALQLKNRKGDDWSASTKYNLQKVAASSVSGFPSSVVKGCTSFKKLIYSEDGLRLIHLLFSSSPEGWGLNNGMFADIDYSQFKSWKEVFSYLNVSQVSQDIIYNALNKIELNKAELDVIKLAEEF